MSPSFSVQNWCKLWLWRKRVKKGSCSCQSILPIISRANAIAAVGNGLQLNTTPHHPSIFLLLGNERKLVLQTFVILDWLVAGLVLGPVDMRCIYQAPNSTESLHTVLLHTSISTVLKCFNPSAQGQKRQGHRVHSPWTPLEDFGPSSWPTDLKSKQALSQQLLHQTQGE